MTPRDDRRTSPSDVLITNHKTLDLLLQYGENRLLWEGDDLALGVLDTFPTHGGAHGTDVATLLLRLAATTGASAPPPSCPCSPTVGS